MPTLQISPIDVKWFVALASGTTYADYPTAFAAAVTLSAGNTNAAVHLSRLVEQLSSVGATGKPTDDLPPGPLGHYLVGLATQTEYYPLDTARVAAYALSAANSNAAVYVAQALLSITAP